MSGALRTAIEVSSRVGGAVAGLRRLEDRQTRLGRTLQATRRQAAALRGRAADLRSAQQRLGDSTGALARDLGVVGLRRGSRGTLVACGQPTSLRRPETKTRKLRDRFACAPLASTDR